MRNRIQIAILYILPIKTILGKHLHLHGGLNSMKQSPCPKNRPRHRRCSTGHLRLILMLLIQPLHLLHILTKAQESRSIHFLHFRVDNVAGEEGLELTEEAEGVLGGHCSVEALSENTLQGSSQGTEKRRKNPKLNINLKVFNSKYNVV